MVFDYKEETKSPDSELLFIVPVLTQLTVVMQLTNVTQHNTAQCNTLLSETTQQTSYPNAMAITDIKNPKKASSFLRPEKENLKLQCKTYIASTIIYDIKMENQSWLEQHYSWDY